jgi:membrane protein insertase Oxa1/YidC/SpoIIIJ
MELTPDNLGNSLVVVMVSYAIAFTLQLFMMYLNWKQSRVNNQMNELIKEVKDIKEILKRRK